MNIYDMNQMQKGIISTGEHCCACAPACGRSHPITYCERHIPDGEFIYNYQVVPRLKRDDVWQCPGCKTYYQNIISRCECEKGNK